MTDQVKDVPKNLYIDGRWEPSSTGENVETYDPATGQVLAAVADLQHPMDLSLGDQRRGQVAGETLVDQVLDFRERPVDGCGLQVADRQHAPVQRHPPR